MANKWAFRHNLTIKYRPVCAYTQIYIRHKEVCMCTHRPARCSYKNSNLAHELSCSYSLTLSLNNFNCNNINWSSSICASRDFSGEIRTTNILFYSALNISRAAHWNSQVIYKELKQNTTKTLFGNRFAVNHYCSSWGEWIVNMNKQFCLTYTKYSSLASKLCSVCPAGERAQKELSLRSDFNNSWGQIYFPCADSASEAPVLNLQR